MLWLEKKKNIQMPFRAKYMHIFSRWIKSISGNVYLICYPWGYSLNSSIPYSSTSSLLYLFRDSTVESSTSCLAWSWCRNVSIFCMSSGPDVPSSMRGTDTWIKGFPRCRAFILNYKCFILPAVSHLHNWHSKMQFYILGEKKNQWLA